MNQNRLFFTFFQPRIIGVETGFYLAKCTENQGGDYYG